MLATLMIPLQRVKSVRLAHGEPMLEHSADVAIIQQMGQFLLLAHRL